MFPNCDKDFNGISTLIAKVSDTLNRLFETRYYIAKKFSMGYVPIRQEDDWEIALDTNPI